MLGECFLKVEDLHRRYGPIHALRGVSFEVSRGEVLGLLGPNGAGKTTTLQILSGALAPSAGRVSIGGKDLFAQPVACKAELGYLPEQPPLYVDLTVDEYLRYCARLRRIPRQKIAPALARAKERCGLDECNSRLIGNLSKGFQQRVGIAQAIIHAPRLVILDEPTVGLDPIQIREIRSLVGELRDEHSVILSTHILSEAQAVCDRVQIIHRGKLVLNSSVHELSGANQPCTIRVALRTPPNIGVLESLPGVEAVETLEPGCFRFRYPPGSNASEQLVAESVRQGWGLFEITPERRSLEEVFVHLTAIDEGPEPPDAGVDETRE